MAKWRNNGARFPRKAGSKDFIERGEVFEADPEDWIVRQRRNKLVELKDGEPAPPLPPLEGPVRGAETEEVEG